ncbi:Protein of unknown function [Pyronema omphalodes CBS 100304]|uniref:Uncharacterized protein n=1 Tax=Pyronema omphalodes (strain CBS 100304) TaxID=1076935 RepID=U4L4Y8_PYROM|nr:Protein of unknown function [Pyronema omphalodes CBS 100304]
MTLAVIARHYIIPMSAFLSTVALAIISAVALRRRIHSIFVKAMASPDVISAREFFDYTFAALVVLHDSFIFMCWELAFLLETLLEDVIDAMLDDHRDLLRFE